MLYIIIIIIIIIKLNPRVEQIHLADADTSERAQRTISTHNEQI